LLKYGRGGFSKKDHAGYAYKYFSIPWLMVAGGKNLSRRKRINPKLKLQMVNIKGVVALILELLTYYYI
jgi:hypothetical protein